MRLTLVFFTLLISAAFLSCNKKEDSTSTSSTDIQENAQQVGDVMASVDETGGTSGSIASMENSIQKIYERYAPGEVNREMIAQVLLSEAQAGTCSASGTFSTCSSSSRIRTFGGCTVGSAVFSGDVTLTWSGATAASCTLAASGSAIVRVPNFTVTGRRGATLTVKKTGSTGQTLSWTSGSTSSDKTFSFSNDGINRKFVSAASVTLFDQTTTVTSAITVTGTTRTTRVMNGGTLRVTNNLNSTTCDYSPASVTWTASCNCPTSGTWSGSCSDGKSTSLVLTGCGTATYTEGSDSESVTFDRCGT